MRKLLSLLLDARRARKGGAAAVTERRQGRLAELVAFARANSPYYRELYQDLPERIEDARSLPTTDKKKLMSRFDDWTPCMSRVVFRLAVQQVPGRVRRSARSESARVASTTLAVSSCARSRRLPDGAYRC